MKIPDQALIRQCAETIHAEEKASTSLIQRRHRLGYVCASNVLATMEDLGLVGAQKGALQRAVNMPELKRFLDNAKHIHPETTPQDHE